MQQTKPAAGHDCLLGVASLRHGLLVTERDEAVQLRLQPLGARKNGAGKFDRRDLPALDQARHLSAGRKQRSSFMKAGPEMLAADKYAVAGGRRCSSYCILMHSMDI